MLLSEIERGANGIRFVVFYWQNGFHSNLVLPSIAEIIVVTEFFITAEVKVMQFDLIGVRVKPNATGAVNAIRLAVDDELMEVSVFPVLDENFF